MSVHSDLLILRANDNAPPAPPLTADRRAMLQALAALDVLRERLSAVADQIIARLDALDGDADFEPWLGATEYRSTWAINPGGSRASFGRLGDVRRWRDGADDREAADDDEPSLGSIMAGDQRRWASGLCTDAEAEHDGREPSLGSTNAWDQRGWGFGDRSDREDDGEAGEPEDDGYCS